MSINEDDGVLNRLLKIDEELILRILANGLGFETVELPSIGSAIKMDSRTAFVYSIITSHGYLDGNEPDNLYRLTRDAFRVFNQALRYDFQEGVFSLSDMRLACTVNNEAARKPYLSNGEKFILPLRHGTYKEFQGVLKQVVGKMISKGLNPNDVIICPVKAGGSGAVELESFFEYVASQYFRSEGFLTDTQIPFFYGVGTPDLAAYMIPETMEAMRKCGYLDAGGSLIDLMTISVFGRYKRGGPIEKSKTEAIVGEVKTSQLAAPQIMKYTDTRIFNKAYEIIPCMKSSESYAGLITIDSKGRLVVLESDQPIPFSEKKQKEYLDWIEQYAKLYLLANLHTDELELVLENCGLELNRQNLLEFIKHNSVQKVIAKVDLFLSER